MNLRPLRRSQPTLTMQTRLPIQTANTARTRIPDTPIASMSAEPNHFGQEPRNRRDIVPPHSCCDVDAGVWRTPLLAHARDEHQVRVRARPLRPAQAGVCRSVERALGGRPERASAEARSRRLLLEEAGATGLELGLSTPRRGRRYRSVAGAAVERGLTALVRDATSPTPPSTTDAPGQPAARER